MMQKCKKRGQAMNLLLANKSLTKTSYQICDISEIFW